MTKRDFFTKVLDLINDPELIDFAKTEISKMDERNANRKSKPSKKSIENAPIKQAILDYLAIAKETTSMEIGVNCGISTQKASSLCVQLVNEGKIKETDIKIPKKGVRKVYSLV